MSGVGDKGELEAGGEGANEVMGDDSWAEGRGGDEVQHQGEAGGLALQLLHRSRVAREGSLGIARHLHAQSSSC